MTETALDRVLRALDSAGCRYRSGSGGQYTAQCPVHGDRNPSLSVCHNGADRVLLNCQTGCATEDIVEALGLAMRDLFDGDTAESRAEQPLRPHIVASYEYTDAHGEVLFRKLRYFPKTFRVQHPDGRGGWAWGLGDVERVLYRLPDVLAAIRDGRPVYVVEGEKDADRAADLGMAATCNFDGAAKEGQRAKWRPAYGDTLRGAHVIAIVDNDEPGYAHGRAIVADLRGKVVSLRVVRAAIERRGADLSDHLDAGHTLDDLVDVVLDSTARSATTSAPEWPGLIPLDPSRTPAPFPADALPPWAAEYVTALAEGTQTPLDLPGCCVLGVLAACFGGRAVVQARPGWREPVNLYLLPVLRPGSRKSAVISATTSPLYEVEKELGIQVKAQIAEMTTLREIAEQSATKARRAAANATGENRDTLSAEAVSASSDVEKIEIPVIPRLVADDVTPEAAASLLADHGGRLAIISAEGGIFDTMAGRYSQGVPILDLWLKGHAGDQLRVDRKGRPSEYVERPALTLLLTVQPSVLAAIARNGAFRGRGLLARFLYSIPQDNLGRRKVGAAPVPAEIEDSYKQHVRKLAKELADWTDPAVLILSPEAHELLLDTERTIEPQLAEEGTLGPVAEWGSKLAGAMLRIAGLLHVASEREAFRVPISRATLSNAIRIGAYFTEHARAAFNLLGSTGTSDATYLLDYLTRKGIEDFTIRSLHVELPRGRFPTADVVTDAVAVLEDHGYVRPVPPPERPGPGRKPSPGYLVRPDVATESTQSTELRSAS